MIKKVLIAEDHESANISVQKTLEDLGITDFQHAYYCDDALEMVKQTAKTDRSYDLMITDLHFEPDDRKVSITNGIDLITAVREVQPDLKILVFSADFTTSTIQMLYNKLDIEGYIRKARHDAQEIKQAIKDLGMHRRYLPRPIMDLINGKNGYEFSTFESAIVKLLAAGTMQKDIPTRLQELQIKPSGLSSVEKKLNQLKQVLNVATNEQLVAFCKDNGII
ncbi:response regulator [Paraflavitalea pollutisoli]|uniref:response regulator n=1 Tax=Paraflavitalea pollutisoli TaxID=3034143 RepID=UPI0023EE09CB|nr:response regulator [Paraflavitalea sp. H1-2-19X]